MWMYHWPSQAVRPEPTGHLGRTCTAATTATTTTTNSREANQGVRTTDQPPSRTEGAAGALRMSARLALTELSSLVTMLRCDCPTRSRLNSGEDTPGHAAAALGASEASQMSPKPGATARDVRGPAL